MFEFDEARVAKVDLRTKAQIARDEHKAKVASDYAAWEAKNPNWRQERIEANEKAKQEAAEAKAKAESSNAKELKDRIKARKRAQAEAKRVEKIAAEEAYNAEYERKMAAGEV